MTKQHNSLIVIAHGSRRDSANKEFFSLVNNLSDIIDGYQSVRPALLEQAQPTLMQACTDTVKLGATHIDVYPLFFNKGIHVEKDIPLQVAQLMEQFDSTDIRLLDYLGSSSLMAELIKQHVATFND